MYGQWCEDSNTNFPQIHSKLFCTIHHKNRVNNQGNHCVNHYLQRRLSETSIHLWCVYHLEPERLHKKRILSKMKLKVILLKIQVISSRKCLVSPPPTPSDAIHQPGQAYCTRQFSWDPKILFIFTKKNAVRGKLHKDQNDSYRKVQCISLKSKCQNSPQNINHATRLLFSRIPQKGYAIIPRMHCSKRKSSPAHSYC